MKFVASLRSITAFSCLKNKMLIDRSIDQSINKKIKKNK